MREEFGRFNRLKAVFRGGVTPDLFVLAGQEFVRNGKFLGHSHPLLALVLGPWGLVQALGFGGFGACLSGP